MPPRALKNGGLLAFFSDFLVPWATKNTRLLICLSQVITPNGLYIYNTVNIWDYSNFIATPLQINIDIEHKPCLGLIFQPPSHGRVSKKRDTILYTWDLQGELPFLQYSRDVASLGPWGPGDLAASVVGKMLGVLLWWFHIYIQEYSGIIFYIRYFTSYHILYLNYSDNIVCSSIF